MAHILFLMSDTGGGHRAACRAIEVALRERHPDRFTFELVDLWKEYTPFPLNTIPQSAARWIDINPSGFSAMFWVWDRLFRSRWWSTLFCKQMFLRMKRLYLEHPADIIVCVHAAFVRPAVYALRKMRIEKPFLTVVTDYAWPQVLWYDNAVDRCCVPTEAALQRGLSLGMDRSQIILTGPPVHPKFSKSEISQREARMQLGWQPDKRTILMIGGGDGTGPLVSTARAIDAQQLDCELVIVTGRNQGLKRALEAMSWKRPVRIYGFIDNIELLMRASDLLITKAGPATITEAAMVGLPILMNGALKNQESPNIEYVVKREAGVYAPGPKKTAECVARLLRSDGALKKLASGARQIAQPDAIWKIVDQICFYAPQTNQRPEDIQVCWT
jgi:1,2-diacylglycerol 3-beta-galactosyltransferase